MATLQKLRNKGPLLVAFVGIALFAFIAGDAWKLFQSNSMDATVGTINGEELSALDFQEIYTRHENAIRAVSPDGSISNAERDNAIQEAWNNFTQLKIAQKQAELTGIDVTPAEVGYILANNASFLLSNMRMPAALQGVGGGINTDSLDYYIADYDNASKNGYISPKTTLLYDFWKDLETQIITEAINSKQAKLVEYGKITNNAVAKNYFELSNNTHDIDIIAYPYSSIADSTVTVTDEEINKFYEENKEFRYKLNNSTRDIKVIAFRMEPSQADKDMVLAEMQEYAQELKKDSANYGEIAMLAQSQYGYNELLWTKNTTIMGMPMFPDDVKLRMDSAEVFELVGPYINYSDTTYNIFMNIKKEEVAEKYLIRAAVVASENADSMNIAAEKLMADLKAGVEFTEAAKEYQHFDSIEFKADEFYQVSQLFGEAKLQSEMYNAPVGEYISHEITPNARIIYQVISKDENTQMAYNTVVIKRPILISTETYNETYNAFSQYITGCKSAEDFQKGSSAPNYAAIYRSIDLKGVNANNVGIANIPSSREALKWVLDENRKADDISNIFECEGDIFMAIAIENVNPQGYVSLSGAINNYGITVNDLLKNELTIDKKAEMMIAEMSGKSFDELKNNSNYRYSPASFVEYSKPTFVSSLNVEEAVISAAVANLEAGSTSAPIKGLNGVYVVKVNAKNSKDATFDLNTVANEQSQLATDFTLRKIFGNSYFQAVNYYAPESLSYIMGDYNLKEALDKLYPIENKSYIYF